MIRVLEGQSSECKEVKRKDGMRGWGKFLDGVIAKCRVEGYMEIIKPIKAFEEILFTETD